MAKRKKAERKFGGRPTEREPEPGKRVHLSLAVPQGLKRRIEAAANERERSISKEAEYRLESSFAQDEAFGGPCIRALALLMASTFAINGQRKATEVGADKDWTHNQECYIAGLAGVVSALVRQSPFPITLQQVDYLIGSVQTAALSRVKKDAR